MTSTKEQRKASRLPDETANKSGVIGERRKKPIKEMIRKFSRSFGRSFDGDLKDNAVINSGEFHVCVNTCYKYKREM